MAVLGRWGQKEKCSEQEKHCQHARNIGMLFVTPMYMQCFTLIVELLFHW